MHCLNAFLSGVPEILEFIGSVRHQRQNIVQLLIKVNS